MSSARVRLVERLFSDHVGIDFSSTEVRVMRLRHTDAGMEPVTYKTVSWPGGVIAEGRIVDAARAVSCLKQLRKDTGIRRAYAALPENLVASELIIVPAHEHTNMRRVVREHFVAAGTRAHTLIYDYRVVGHVSGGIAVQVFFADRIDVEAYIAVCTRAGIALIGIEPRHAALARAVTSAEEAYLVLIDIRDEDTAISMLANGLPLVTHVAECGGTTITAAIAQAHGVSHDTARTLRDKHGITSKGEGAKAFQEVGEVLVRVEHMVNRALAYWYEQKSWHPSDASLGKFLLSGSVSTMPGLAEYLSGTLRHEIQEANVWQNCFSFEEVIPSITKDKAASYAAAIGLALAAKQSIVSLLPTAIEHAAVRQEQVRYNIHKAFMIVASIVLAVLCAALAVVLYKYIAI